MGVVRGISQAIFKLLFKVRKESFSNQMKLFFNTNGKSK